MLQIKNLTKKFGPITAVENLSLEIESGQIYALIGPNGAGKTTTIKVIAGLYHPNLGGIEFLGKDLLKGSPENRRLIGYIPDEPFFYPGLSGMEFLNFTCALYKVSRNRREEVLSKLSNIFPLNEFLDEDPQSYSRGNKQKLAICSAFLPETKLLLIDEPIVGLDPQSAKNVLKLFTEFSRYGGSILVSTHTLSVAEEIADRVGIIERGKLIVEGNLAELRKKAKVKTANLEEIFLKLTQE